MRTTTEQQQFYLNDVTGDRGFGDLIWNIVERGKLISAPIHSSVRTALSCTA